MPCVAFFVSACVISLGGNTPGWWTGGRREEDQGEIVPTNISRNVQEFPEILTSFQKFTEMISNTHPRQFLTFMTLHPWSSGYDVSLTR